MDGSRSGAVTPSGSDDLIEIAGCVGGRPKIEDSKGGWMPCQPNPAYRSDFPTTVVSARKAIYHNDFVGTDHHDDYSAFECAGELLMERKLKPAARAVVFEALATIPGITVAADAVTAAGTTGVVVARVDTGRESREELIFDPRAYTLIGRRSIDLPVAGKRGREVVAYSAGVIETGIVTRVRLRPDGTVRPGPIEPS